MGTSVSDGILTQGSASQRGQSGGGQERGAEAVLTRMWDDLMPVTSVNTEAPPSLILGTSTDGVFNEEDQASASFYADHNALSSSIGPEIGFSLPSSNMSYSYPFTFAPRRASIPLPNTLGYADSDVIGATLSIDESFTAVHTACLEGGLAINDKPLSPNPELSGSFSLESLESSPIPSMEHPTTAYPEFGGPSWQESLSYLAPLPLEKTHPERSLHTSLSPFDDALSYHLPTPESSPQYTSPSPGPSRNSYRRTNRKPYERLSENESRFKEIKGHLFEEFWGADGKMRWSCADESCDLPKAIVSRMQDAGRHAESKTKVPWPCAFQDICKVTNSRKDKIWEHERTVHGFHRKGCSCKACKGKGKGTE